MGLSRVTGPTLSVIAMMALAGCAGDAESSTSIPPVNDRITVRDGRPFDEVFVVVDTLIMEESPTVVTVAPRVSLDSGGGFLVADEAEHQVRVYTNRGQLAQVFGEGTDRVDSIKSPGRARRLPNGDILVVNLQGPLTLIPARLEEASRFIPESLRTVRNAEVLSAQEILLVGTDSEPTSATLFRLELPSGRITASLFPPPAHLDRWVTTYMSAVRTSRRGDRIAAAHMLSDTLVFFDRSGTEQSRVRIPIDPFTAPSGPLPNLKTTAERYAWTARFTMVMDVFWVADDRLIVQWAKASGTGLEADWGILQMDTTGRLEWAIAPSPVLVGVRGDEFLFRDPGGKAMNRWMVAKRRSTL
jgi:hypothetical protein